MYRFEKLSHEHDLLALTCRQIL